MKRTGFVYDERYLLHDTGEYHPESPERLKAIYKGLSESGLLDKLTMIAAEKANQRWIEAVHNIRYIMRFEETCIMGLSEFDHSDNAICRDTYGVALLAVGGVLKAIDEVMAGNVDNAFCAVRPPGHHAEVDSPMGFCYFNNVAIGARYLQKQYGIERVGIIDFDVHHGNGTQHIFDQDPSVFYYSIHEHPSFAYPGTGREFETGVANGTGFTLNSPVLPGKGDDEYRKMLMQDMVPAFKQFKPEVILLSAGFDAHVSDLMSGTNLTTDGYDFVTEVIVNLVNKFADGRVISVLEGGYNLDVLPLLVENHIKIMADIR
ncbi:MAG: histone deacetylase [Desulfobulbaceae bacterium S3730MH12]|nr:MAG: histone deacetylase [Desulfobulbaceae bacterium S5133MH15]OEU55880.1 MAG: histone deacetylase [Desulfobulbaceae bacterium S3730MH12]OEU81978.1 MAG: histone deacetylase [Desulfobulbaceae bacterium C00003063]